MNVPNHIAIIMDGNGRWAKGKFLPKKAGHKKGAETLLDISKYCNAIGVKYLTVYAFSTENWKRDEKEVNTLMDLLNTYLDEFFITSNADNARVTVIGDVSGLSIKLQDKISKVIEATKYNKGLTTVIAINYGGRDEIIRTAKKLVATGMEINEENFSKNLDLHMPDPDLLIRTSNELRLSNFLLWQLAYSEFYFTDVLWPDFSRKDLDDAIEEFNKRNRRYGGRK
ncbi:MAG: polyprenyl diphosphate synthase [Lachnospirales bacterium]